MNRKLKNNLKAVAKDDDILNAYITLYIQSYLVEKDSYEVEKFFDLISYRINKYYDLDIENLSFKELFDFTFIEIYKIED